MSLARKPHPKTQWNVGYWLIALLALLMLQTMWQARTIEPVPFSEFEKALADGRVAEVIVGETTITGKLKNPDAGKTVIIANRVDLPTAEWLDQYEVPYARTIESTWLRDLLSWVFPLLIFVGLWFFLIRRMASRMGGVGGFMNIGKSRAKVYVEQDTGVTFADVAGYRFAQTPFRTFAACGSLVVVAFYLIAQMVGAGQLIKLLFGLDYWIAVVLVGALMMIYVFFGGMTATTWVQIIKACLLLAGVTFMGIMVLAKYGFSPGALFAEGVRVKTQIAEAGGAAPDLAARMGLAIMGPGGFIKDPISAISFGMALMFGTLGLPHVLMRFFTVPNAKEARKSVFWAATWIGYFYIIIFFIGFGAITLVLTDPSMADTSAGVIKGGGGAANMAAVLVGQKVGGNIFYGFISAVAFATILAVVAGLTLAGASAVSHDLYSTVFKKGLADSASELRVSRITTVVLGVIAVLLGIAFENQNIAFMVSLAFAVAASANLPPMMLSVLWKDCTTRGAVIGGWLGLISSVGLTIVSPSVWEATLGNPPGSAWFPYTSPALFSMTIGFVGVWLFSITDRSERAAYERSVFPAQQVRSETGLGASQASSH